MARSSASPATATRPAGTADLARLAETAWRADVPPPGSLVDLPDLLLRCLHASSTATQHASGTNIGSGMIREIEERAMPAEEQAELRGRQEDKARSADDGEISVMDAIAAYCRRLGIPAPAFGSHLHENSPTD
jgi:hypothetical protein